MQDKIKVEFEQLIEHGRETLKHTNFGSTTHQPQINLAQTKYFTFRTRALNLVGRACGTDSDHYLGLRRLAEDKETANDYGYYPSCLGIVEAAQYDFDSGLLFEIKSLISTEILGDFIEQAEALLQAGYYIPAASLLGAVLEDTLRKLCLRHAMAVPAKTNINGLNSDLAKVGQYNLLTRKQITAYADIRNNTDHGHYGEFSKDDVEEMMKWLRRFAEQHLG